MCLTSSEREEYYDIFCGEHAAAELESDLDRTFNCIFATPGSYSFPSSDCTLLGDFPLKYADAVREAFTL